MKLVLLKYVLYRITLYLIDCLDRALSIIFGQPAIEAPKLSAEEIEANKRCNATVSIHNQTREICSKEHIRVTNKLKTDELISSYSVHTLYDGFMRGCRIAGDKECLGYRPNLKSPYKWSTYNEIKQRSSNFGAGLIGLVGCKGTNDQFLGIYARNMVEWVVAEKGSLFYSMVLVPMYNTLGDQAMRYIVDQVGMEVMVLDCGASLKSFNDDVLTHPEGKAIKKVVLIEQNAEDAELIKTVEAAGVKVFSFDDVEKYGAEHPLAHCPPKSEDLATINYTSGTTGNPKGVMLTHANFVADSSAANYMLPRPMNVDDVWYSYLPLPHVFERMVQTTMYQSGCKIGFFSGDIRAMPSDLAALRPTIFGGVRERF